MHDVSLFISLVSKCVVIFIRVGITLMTLPGSKISNVPEDGESKARPGPEAANNMVCSPEGGYAS